MFDNLSQYDANYFKSLPSVNSYRTIDPMNNIMAYGQGMFNSLGNWLDNATSDGGFLTSQRMWGGPNSTGWVAPATQALGALGQGWLGMQQLDLAKQNLAFQKDAFNKNYQNQVQLTNMQLEDRQRRRNLERPDLFQAPTEEWRKMNLLGGGK